MALTTISRSDLKRGTRTSRALRPAAESIAGRMSSAVSRKLDELHQRTIAAMKRSLRSDNAVSQSRIEINALMQEYEPIFNKLAKNQAKRMISEVNLNSEVTLRHALRDIMTVDVTATNARLEEVIKAGTEQAAGLIKRIPEQYLGQVQGAVMRSITTGRGMQDLLPFMVEKYEGQKKWAHHVALDQTHKAYQSMNRARLDKIGCEEFVWVHSSGSKQPRELHKKMNGQVYRFDDPPIIDEKSGERGFPGDAPFCGCTLRPRFNLKKLAGED